MPASIRFGRYELIERLAVGGMAELFLARSVRDAGFEKLCVVKRVLPHLSRSRQFLEMFLDEARIAAQLSHPGICQVFDLGKEGDDYYLAMEHLAGEDLGAVLDQCAARDVQLPWELACQIAAAAAEALHYAHEFRGHDGAPLDLVHRDVSPSNLMVTYQGTVKLLDFGISRARAHVHQTEPGTLRGKFAYLAPEILRDEALDRRVDIWALGACLFEWLTGRRLVEDGSLEAAHRRAASPTLTPPSRLRPGIPEGADAVVLKALQESPQERFPTAEAMREALDALLREHGRPGPVELSRFLTGLFGEARAAQRLRPLGQGPLASAGPGTDVLPPSPSSEPTVLTVVEPGPSRRRQSGVWVASAAVLLALLLAGIALSNGGRTGRDAQEDSAVVPAPAPEPAPQAPPEAKSEAVPSEEEARPPPTRAERPVSSASLRLAVNVPANIWIDGIQRGSAPLLVTHLSAGEHVVRLESPTLGLARTFKVRLVAGKQTTRVERFAMGKLNVMVDPWADVWLDGQAIGQTPLAGRDVWEGRHELRLVSPLGEKRVSIQVDPDQTLVVKERLP